MSALPGFELLRPSSVEEAAQALRSAAGEAAAIAGGTDLVVRLRQRLQTPRVLVALAGLEAMRGVRPDADGGLLVGAGERLEAVASDPRVREHAPSLAAACGAVGHPQVRAMGTLGGNVCLPPRCVFVDQTLEWREAGGGCLRTGGERCHVVPAGRRCVASACADTVAPLLALGADLVVQGPDASRRVPVAGVRAKDGRDGLALYPDELVTAVALPPPAPRRRTAYLRWSLRRAVDFPLVSAAVVWDRDDRGRTADLRVAVAALGPRPRLVTGLDRYRGEALTPAVAAAVADRAMQQAKALDNLSGPAWHRSRVLRALLHRQLERWADR